MRKTKIVCTLGPSSSSAEMIEKLIQAGMNVARLNFSHGTHAGHAQVLKRIRAVSRRLRQPVAVLMDLQGPKIRTGRVTPGVVLKAGQPLTLTSRELMGTASLVSTNYRGLSADLKPGDAVLVNDGRIRLLVEKVKGLDVQCLVQVGGELSDHKGINLPGVRLSIPSLTPKDLADLKFGMGQGVDYVAMSFVRQPSDILRLKQRMERAGGRDIPVIAKIEKPEAVEQLAGILKVCEGIMVARGDLGVEMSPEQVPILQKDLIARANQAQVLVITATQMLESMVHSPQPTRAEASDVANAIFDGTDAVMLSQETAVGSYPLETVAMMGRICEAAEASFQYISQHSLENLKRARYHSVPDTICHAARVATEDLPIKVVVCFTQSGATARYLSKYRPQVRIIAYSPSQSSVSRMSLYWGTQPRYLPLIHKAENLFKGVERALKGEGVVAKGDLILIVSGTPIGQKGSINLLKAHKIN